MERRKNRQNSNKSNAKKNNTSWNLLNNKPLKLRKKRAGSQIFDVPYELAKYGANEVIVKATGKNKRGQTAKLGNIAMDVIFDQNDGEVAQ